MARLPRITPLKRRQMSGWTAMVLINLSSLAVVAGMLLIGATIDRVFFSG